MLIRESVSLPLFYKNHTKHKKESQAVQCSFYVGMYFYHWDLNS